MVQKRESEFLEEFLSNSIEGEESRKALSEMGTKHGLKPYEVQNVASFYGSSNRKVKICRGLPCRLKGNSSDVETLQKFPDEELEEVSCLGYCDQAPVAWSNGTYFHLENKNTEEIDLQKHSDGLMEVRNLEEFLGSGGFKALLQFISKSDPAMILKFVEDVGLKGFGGSGFPAYVKWKAVSDSRSKQKYLLVNAHEGEPGTFKDRVLMEANPFELIEASLLAALVIGATDVVIALKHEYIQAEKALKAALDASLEYLKDRSGVIGLPELRILRVPGYYITGEESALMEAIEGRRSEPRLRPPYPAEIGLYGKPTLIDNVETLLYFLGRLREHSSSGETGPGDKSYCLTGDVENPGSYRLPYGTYSTDLITGKGGTELSELKAVLPGGLSGGILPAAKGNIKLNFESAREAGAGMGTGAIIAISNDRCMVDIMGTVESFFRNESCGKCMPCRYGTVELADLFRKLKQGTATSGDIDSGKKAADVMLRGSICGLGQASAKMFLDSMKFFGEEMMSHVSGSCPANVCKMEVP